MRFGKVCTTSGHQKRSGFPIAAIGRRVSKFIWEVLLQGKVIRQRPLPGLAHAFVFWGFCAFALVTINHFAEGFGLQFFPATAFSEDIYFAIAAVFAVAVAISIAGLRVPAIRDPSRSGWGALYESGVDRAAYFHPDGRLISRPFFPVGGQPSCLWWAHTLTILVFLPLIPHTKHLHLVLSPVTVFLKRDGFSKIPPLVGRRGFRPGHRQGYHQMVSLQAYSCVECGRCTEHCPAANTGKVLNPKEIALGVRGYLNDFGPKSEEPLLGKYLSQEAAFQCTTCGACEFQCPVGVQHLPIIIGLRRGAVNTGKWEDDYGTKLFLNLERNGNSLGFSSTERDKFIQKQEFPILRRHAGVLSVAGLHGCLRSAGPRDRRFVCAGDAASQCQLRCAAQRKMHRRSGAAFG